MRAAVTAVVITCLLGACASDGDFTDIRVDSRTNPSFAMSELRTYAWLVDTAMVRDPDAEWTPGLKDVGAELRAMMDRELRLRGRSTVDVMPDMFARLEFGVDMKATAMKVDGAAGSARFESRPTGGFQIVLVERITRQDVWAARAMGNVTENISPEDSRRRLTYAIREMFEGFPD